MLWFALICYALLCFACVGQDLFVFRPHRRNQASRRILFMREIRPGGQGRRIANRAIRQREQGPDRQSLVGEKLTNHKIMNGTYESPYMLLLKSQWKRLLFWTTYDDTCENCVFSYVDQTLTYRHFQLAVYAVFHIEFDLSLKSLRNDDQWNTY